MLDVRADERGRSRAEQRGARQLIEHVGVRSRQVSDDVVREDEPFEHRLMDDPSDQLLIGAERIDRLRPE